MKPFSYTIEDHELVSEALGDKWSHFVTSDGAQMWNFVPDREVFAQFHVGYEHRLIGPKILNPTVCFGDRHRYELFEFHIAERHAAAVADVWAEMHAAIDRLKAAGLREVNQ